jgi:predicted ATPase
MLKSLKLHGVGPVRDLSATFGERLNIVTGDNGLGKSFLLDVCFWVLTGTWPGRRMAIPDSNFKSPEIIYEVKSKTKAASREAGYSFRSQLWNRQRGRPPMPGLVIYAAIDGSFAVWDPARNYWRDNPHFRHPEEFDPQWPRAFQFPPESVSDYDDIGTATIRRDVANGLEEAGQVLCNGLISDWSEWFYQRSSEPVVNAFEYLEEVVAVLSHPTEPIRCVEPRKVYLTDSRKFPALELPYGVVSYPHWSAGVKRIVNFAYLLVWAWVSHLEAAEMRKDEATRRIILLIDEVEAHLHPKWQRTILPAIQGVVEKLQKDVEVQILAATHSPLVLASLEPTFDEATDQLFSFNLDASKPAHKMVTFDALPWAVHGDVVAWLTSDVFGLGQARSRQAERAIEAAEAFMRGDTDKLPDNLKTKAAIDAELRRVLGGLDPFWPRWVVEASE